jgi:nitrite reductase/ring-hydroxylating ferredoxin subunit
MNPIDGLVPDWRALPGAPAPGTELCQLADVPADNGLERRFGPAGSGFSVVLFRAGESVCAFVNRCPHAGIALNFGDDVFCLYDSDGERDVICPHHSALFRLPEGVCHEGPCRDDRLTPVPLAVEAGVVRIAPAR